MDKEQYEKIKRYYNECKVDVSLKPGDKKYVDFDEAGLRGEPGWPMNTTLP